MFSLYSWFCNLPNNVLGKINTVKCWSWLLDPRTTLLNLQTRSFPKFGFVIEFFIEAKLKKHTQNDTDTRISLSRHEQVCLSGLRFERYFSRWWEKYLSKLSPLKHTCSWRDKLVVSWILNRQAKIFLRILTLDFTTD